MSGEVPECGMIIGLTGGIGCGKSSALAGLILLGFNGVDADQLARQALESADSLRQMRIRWGGACVGPDGRPDRRWIAEKVFGDATERAFLEGLTHPEVARRRAEAVADVSRHHVVEIPLLFEKELAAGFSAIVCVACSEEVRRGRLLKKGLSPDQINQRSKSQMSTLEKVKRSDYVLWNDGDPGFLQAQVADLVGRLMKI